MRQTVSFQHKAVYYQTGEITDHTKELWFVLHGYGQLPQYFIRKFKDIETEKRVIIAPGGLSKFYLEGFYGRVGSSWMTKEERLLDIENYIVYLNALADQLLEKVNSNMKITLLGFSQGTATVCRWAEKLDFQFEKLILHSGAFPPDVSFKHLGDILKDKQVYMLRGDQDEFINEEREREQEDLINKLNLKVNHIEFKGKHDIHIDSLKDIIKQ
ncbi:alpha/beta hydrolase [Marivirga arenosa]|uniref:Phospholipase/carboxylesterase/thioesterase domain-containing protein n=1 Tax=Marivirga arenosa TaxID=3059076 RepID=A0AA51ZV39_9BACT|nr:hypothetical protein [Marivirga sp. BKB1-2]WNB17299.1 hypothetical protein QYS47_33515 [Marivirga sp. BKB1-2]